MAQVKHILVVDDQFEILEFLRSMLKVSNRDYEVVAVPSAEEGLFALRQTPFDLLITDVRLLGMSGYDFVRQLKVVRPNLPVMVMSGHMMERDKWEAADLSIVRYFPKPLDMDEILTAVHTTLFGSAPITLTPSPTIGYEPATAVADIHDRLAALRIDTGAVGMALAQIDGQICLELFDQPHRLDLARVVQLLAQNVQTSFLLADTVKSEELTTLHYYEIRPYRLYSANIGRGYLLLLFFDFAERRGRISSIWVFTQRALKDLELLLRGIQGKDFGFVSPPTAVALAEEPTPASIEQPVEPDIDLLLPDPGVNLHEVLGLDPGQTAVKVDLDAFWDDALSSHESSRHSEHGGLSFAEALQRGLIPSGLASDKDDGA